MQKVKVNDYCEFPMELNMEPYTKQGLKKKEKEEKQKDKQQPEEESPAPETEKKYPEEYFKYRLRGVVVHQGIAEGGHYYSYIQDRESEKWHEYNDTYVSDFKEGDIPDECFGGEEKWGSMMNFRTHVKTRNAYLVFYERISEYEPPKSDDEVDEDVKMKEDNDLNVPSEIADMISLNNQRYWQNKFLFAKEYID